MPKKLPMGGVPNKTQNKNCFFLGKFLNIFLVQNFHLIKHMICMYLTEDNHIWNCTTINHPVGRIDHVLCTLIELWEDADELCDIMDVLEKHEERNTKNWIKTIYNHNSYHLSVPQLNQPNIKHLLSPQQPCFTLSFKSISNFDLSHPLPTPQILHK